MFKDILDNSWTWFWIALFTYLSLIVYFNFKESVERTKQLELSLQIEMYHATEKAINVEN